MPVVYFRYRLWRLEELEPRDCPAVPALSSLPGANHTIYLDFDGHVTTGTPWNGPFGFNNPTINSPAYDTDGDPSTFNASELADIDEAFNRIAEDFRPFNVNVTTVDPGLEALRMTSGNDTQWGIRVVITDDTESTGAGGVAYIGSFNWDTDTPAFVYVTGGKNISEAGSHEVGHSLGLQHDGTQSGLEYYAGHGSGATSWAPIMGVGYTRNVTQWDTGEYFDTNNGGAGANGGNGPDDLAIITSSTNGFGYRLDDHGDTNSEATPLTVAGTNLSGTGIITTRSDVDVFSFVTGAGTVNLNIDPFTPGPNLDVKAELYDSTGALIVSSDPAASLSASISQVLSPGQYFLHIDGTGTGTPGLNPASGYTDYASLGQYTVTGTIVAPPGPLPSLSINNLTVNEGSGTATFTVRLTGTITAPVSVAYATSNGTATAGEDYQARTGVLTFTPSGPTTQSVVVPIINDFAGEGVEHFFVDLSNATGGAIISDAQGQCTIQDNDNSLPRLDIWGRSSFKREGTRSGVTRFTFTIRRSGSVRRPAAVSFAVSVPGLSGAYVTDFSPFNYPRGRVRFAAMQRVKVITIRVRADNLFEANEAFQVTLFNPVRAVLGNATANGMILNDDPLNRGGRQNVVSPFLIQMDPREWFGDSDSGHDHAGHGQGCCLCGACSLGVFPASNRIEWEVTDEHSTESEVSHQLRDVASAEDAVATGIVLASETSITLEQEIEEEYSVDRGEVRFREDSDNEDQTLSQEDDSLEGMAIQEDASSAGDGFEGVLDDLFAELTNWSILV